MKRLIKARKVLVVLPTPAEHRRNLRERRKAKNWSQPTAYSVLSNDRARIERFAKRQHIPTFTLTAIEAKINAIEQERYILELEELGVDWAAQKGLEVLAEMYYS
jgi:transcriptional regulator with XRE-family HTH domain